VDDDPLSCELICEILLAAGMQASSVTDSAEAARRLNHDKYDAVFLDMRMGPPDGVQLAGTVRASRMNASTVIVMISGEEDRSLMTRAFEAGVNFFLFKPIERSKLLKLIRVAEGSIERERRRFIRIRLRCSVSVETDKERLEGTTLDLSLGGALIQSQRTFPIGTPVTLNFELAAGMPSLRSAARVVRIIGTDCMGVQFKTLGAEETTQLQGFLLPRILTAD
jgi:DNA-binding response OmpR family regulator